MVQVLGIDLINACKVRKRSTILGHHTSCRPSHRPTGMPISTQAASCTWQLQPFGASCTPPPLTMTRTFNLSTLSCRWPRLPALPAMLTPSASKPCVPGALCHQPGGSPARVLLRQCRGVGEVQGSWATHKPGEKLADSQAQACMQ